MSNCTQTPKVVVVQKGTTPTQAELRTQADLQTDPVWQQLMKDLKK